MRRRAFAAAAVALALAAGPHRTEAADTRLAEAPPVDSAPADATPAIAEPRAFGTPTRRAPVDPAEARPPAAAPVEAGPADAAPVPGAPAATEEVDGPVEAGRPGAEPLTLEEFLRRAVRADTEFERILIDALDLRYRRALRLPPRDVVFDVRQELQLSLDEGAENATTAGVTWLFPETGTEVGAAYRSSPVSGGRASFSDATLSLAQSIAENAFGRSTRLLERIVGLENDVARHQIVEAYEDYLAVVAGLYLDWWEAAQNLEIARSSLEQNRRLLGNMRSRRRSRIALPVDVDKVELEVLGREQRLVEAEESWRSRANLVARVLRLPDGDGLEPVAPAIDPPEAPFAESFDAFERDGRTLAILRLLEDKSSLDLEREVDDLLPSVDLLLTYRAQGTGAEIAGAEHDFLAGIGIRLPLRDPVARAEAEVARLAVAKAEIDTENLRVRLETDLRNLRLAIDRERRLAEIEDAQVALARRVLDAEAENYSYAKVTLNDYIQAVNVLDANRFERARREAAWRKLVIEWRRLTDRLAGTAEVVSRVPAPPPRSGP